MNVEIDVPTTIKVLECDLRDAKFKLAIVKSNYRQGLCSEELVVEYELNVAQIERRIQKLSVN